MKVLHVMAGAAGGGAETAFAELCAAQTRNGTKLLAACRPSTRNDEIRKSGADVTELPFGGIFDFKTRPALKKLIADQEPDVIVSWMNRAAKKMPRKTNVPWIARLGGYYDLKYYKHVDHFVVNAPDIGRWMQDKGVPADKITFIPNFAEVDTDAKPVDRASLDTPNDAFVFLALSRLHKNKAIDTLLSAFALVPDAILWIGGEGPERDRLEKQARDLGISDRVRFLGWREDRWSLLAACDTFVLPSRHEPFGNSFMQAWAAGKPLISTASQGPSHYIRDHIDGVLTPIDDVNVLATALDQMRLNPSLRESLASAGQAHYKEAFDKKAILDRWQELFDRVVKIGN